MKGSILISIERPMGFIAHLSNMTFGTSFKFLHISSKYLSLVMNWLDQYIIILFGNTYHRGHLGDHPTQRLHSTVIWYSDISFIIEQETGSFTTICKMLNIKNDFQEKHNYIHDDKIKWMVFDILQLLFIKFLQRFRILCIKVLHLPHWL